MQRETGEAANPVKGGRETRGQDSHRRDQILASHPLVVVDYDFPSIRVRVINGAGDPRAELDLAP